jgi:hypothetical protein
MKLLKWIKDNIIGRAIGVLLLAITLAVVAVGTALMDLALMASVVTVGVVFDLTLPYREIAYIAAAAIFLALLIGVVVHVIRKGQKKTSVPQPEGAPGS